MVSFLKTSVLVTLLAAITNGSPVVKRHDKYIVHELERDDSSLDKRTETESQWFSDTGARWFTKLKLGSAKDPVRVTVDTGSYRLNVPVPGATCLKTTCAPDAVFHPENSSTYKNLTEESDSTYSGPATKSFKSTDDVFFDDGRKIPGFEFDASFSSSGDIGVFGVGNAEDANSNYVFATKHAGLTNRAGYSIYLGPEKNQGNLLLGGIDKAKYKGELAIFDAEQNINATSIITADGKAYPFTKPVGFDTGNAWIGLEASIVDGIYEGLGIRGEGYFECDRVLNTTDEFTFNLGPINITVPYSSFFYRLHQGDYGCAGHIYKVADDAGAQGIGLPFLREVYYVKDLENKRIGIAPIKHTDESNIVDFWF
ncbi:hypothetical protein KGF57_004371 [Candida theae]|uniref:Peptidase A1 domain-containing protein n=1 Tax=Candida theae TaxID=1198502 RepID=A0AAD5BB95_9ASCO|nr:uncharacterized protein KGF57_004371 [Candida theae]KAI5950204.1 hypothetical protein KGF57_004371 [Candida theae]